MQKSTQQNTAFVFGAVLIAILLGIAFAAPNPTPFQYTVFRIVLALAAAGVAGMIPGFLNVEVGTAIRATGAIAVFVIVYFFSPAALVVTPDSSPNHPITPESQEPTSATTPPNAAVKHELVVHSVNLTKAGGEKTGREKVLQARLTVKTNGESRQYPESHVWVNPADIRNVLFPLSNSQKYIISFQLQIRRSDVREEVDFESLNSGDFMFPTNHPLGQVQTYKLMSEGGTLTAEIEFEVRTRQSTVSETFTEQKVPSADTPSKPADPLQVPILIEIKIIFQTTKDNKDQDTKISMWMKSDGKTIAHSERFAGDVEFKNNSDSPPFVIGALAPNLKKSQISRGLTSQLRMEANGDDNWWFRFKTECLFSDGSQIVMQHPIEERFDDDERVEAEFTLKPQ